MPHNPLITARRSFLGVAAGAVAATSLAQPAPAVAPHPDAGLLTACNTFMAAGAEVRRLIDEPGATDDEMNAANDAWERAARDVALAPATTPEGVKAKASATVTALDIDYPGVGSTASWLAAHLAHDILGASLSA